MKDNMTNRLNHILLAILFLWAPLALFTRAQEGFILTKEVLAVSALTFLLTQAVFTNGKNLLRHWLLRWSFLFLGWMVIDSMVAGLIKTEAVRGMVHVFLLVSVISVVVWAAPRIIPYEKLVHYSLLSGVLMALYGIAQAMGLDQSIQWDNRFDNRVFSTLGNPNYLGGHFVALLPVSFVLGLRSSNPKAKWFWLGLTGLLFTGLLATRVRGADLAFAGSFGLMGILFLLPWGRDLAKRNLGLLLSFLVVFLLTGGVFIQRHGGLSSFGASEVSVQQRLETYKVTWEIIKDNSLFGIGVGQLGAQYPRYQYRPYQPSEYPQHPYTYTEHVHNEFLQFLAEGGWPGLILFLGLLMAFFSAVASFVWNPQNQIKDKDLIIGILGAVTAVLIQSLSNFPLQIPPTVIVFGLWLAAPLALNQSTQALPQGERAGGARMRVTFWVSLVSVLMIFLIGIRLLASSVAYRDTIGETALKNYQNAIYYGQRLTTLSPGSHKAWYGLGKAFEGADKPIDAISAYGKAVEVNPNYVEGYLALGMLQLQADLASEAVTNLEKAENLTPNYAGPIWFHALGLFQLKQFEQAAMAFEKFLICSPDNTQAYSNLGVCFIQQKRKTEAVEAWKKAYSLNPADQQVVQYLRAQGVQIR